MTFIDCHSLNAIIITNEARFFVPQYLQERFDIKFTRFKDDSNSEKRVGQWIAHPKIRFGKFYDEYSVYSNIVVYKEDGIATIDMDLEFGLSILCEMLRTSVRLAIKYKIRGAVPVDINNQIDRRLLSNMRRKHIKLGIWPN